jgi:VCBS repeat-containing protein
MADSYVQIAPDSTGKLIDNQSLTNGSSQTVYRQTVTVGDPALYGSVQAVRAGGSAVVPASDGAAVVAVRDALPTGANVIGAVTQSGAWSMSISGTVAATISGSVAVTGTFWQTTQPVSAASLPLPTGAAADSHLTNVQSAPGAAQTVAVTIQGNASGIAIPVSAASLPLPTGAATSALQPTNATQGSTTSGQTGTLSQGAVTTSAPTYTTAQTSPLSLTINGALRTDQSTLAGSALGAPSAYGTSPGAVTVQGVNSFVTNTVAVSAASLPLPAGASTSALQPTNAAQGSTTSGQTGRMLMGAVTTSAPSYTTAQTNPLSLTTAGALRVDASATTQPVSGSVTQTNTPVGSAAFAVGQVAMTATAAAIVAARTGVAGTGRIVATIYNKGSNTIEVGGSGVTYGAGLPILPGGSLDVATQAAVYGICNTSLTSTAAYLESY